MDYLKIYDSFIQARKASEKPDGYIERHHILPRSLGGVDDEENIVFLSARDHFFAHLLLSKIFSGPMDIALWRMCQRKSQGSNFRVITSRQFSTIRQNYAKEMSARFKGKPRPQWVKDKISSSLKGRVFTEEWKANISKGQTGVKRGPMKMSQRKKISERMKGEKNHRFGIPTSERQKEAVRKSSSGEKNCSYNHEKFVFVHDSGTKEYCTQNQLRKKYHLNHGNLSMVCSGKRSKVSGWSVKS